MIATKGQISTDTPRVRVGSHLRVLRIGYQHHGIYIGRKRVIHFSGESKTIAPSATIREDSLEDFIYGGPMGDEERKQQFAEIIEYESRLPAQEIVKRARSKIGSADYNLFGNNCEHFATWCVTGDAHSTQVQTVVWSGAIGLLVKNYVLETELGQTALSFTAKAAKALGLVAIGAALGGAPVAVASAAVLAVNYARSGSDEAEGKKDPSAKA
jgi:hypothetical protein